MALPRPLAQTGARPQRVCLPERALCGLSGREHRASWTQQVDAADGQRRPAAFDGVAPQRSSHPRPAQVAHAEREPRGMMKLLFQGRQSRRLGVSGFLTVSGNVAKVSSNRRLHGIFFSALKQKRRKTRLTCHL